MLQITSGIEALSDECASLVHSLQKYINKNPDKKTSSYEKLLPYMTQVKEFFDYVSQHLSLGLTAEEKKLSAEMEQSIDSTKKQLKKLARLYRCDMKAIYVVDTATLKELTISKFFVTEESLDYENSLTEDGKRYLRSRRRNRCKR